MFFFSGERPPADFSLPPSARFGREQSEGRLVKQKTSAFQQLEPLEHGFKNCGVSQLQVIKGKLTKPSIS